MDVDALVMDMFVGVAYVLEPELFTSVTAKMAARLNFSDRAEAITTVAELLASLLAVAADTLQIVGAMPSDYIPALSGQPEDGELAMDGSTIRFTGLEFVRPVSPEIVAVSLDQSDVNEGDTVTVSGQFVDAGSSSSHRVMYDWGNGTGSRCSCACRA